MCDGTEMGVVSQNGVIAQKIAKKARFGLWVVGPPPGKEGTDFGEHYRAKILYLTA